MTHTLPLAGKKVVVTRARAEADKLVVALERLGATVLEFPTIKIRLPETPPDIPPLDRFDWIVLTSANAVTNLAHILAAADRTFKETADTNVCAVGPATESAAQDHGLRVSLVPKEFIAEGVVDALRDVGLSGKSVFLPRGNIARPNLPEALRDMGANVTEAVVYETVSPEPDAAASDAVVAARPDLVTFTSGSTARNYVTLMGPERLAALAGQTRYAAIGPQTAEEARQAGVDVAIEPDRHDIPGLVAAIVDFYNSESESP